MRWLLGLAVVCFVSSCWGSGSCLAEEQAGIVVSATGVKTAKPSRLEIHLTTSGQAELSGDAMVKYDSAVKNVTEALSQLKIENLSIEQQGMSVTGIGVTREMEQAGAAGQKMPISITRSMRVVVTGIESRTEKEIAEIISQLLDTAKDSGAVVSQSSNNALLARMMGQTMSNSLVTFVVDEPDKTREEASRVAFEKARTQAARLAQLAGRELGSVISIQESIVPTRNEDSMQMRVISMMYGMKDKDEHGEERITSDRFTEIPIRVDLQVRFALRPLPEDK